jgi:hypothetical protein
MLWNLQAIGDYALEPALFSVLISKENNSRTKVFHRQNTLRFRNFPI